MLWQPALPQRYLDLDDDELSAAITARREALGSDLLILGHHYQRDDVIRHADLTGDSLKLSRMAAEASVQRGVKAIVFCGVHFMAETADVLTDESVQVILPDLSAGCSMADMADYEDVVDAWSLIRQSIDERTRVIPITYVNSSAAVKAFVGEHGGACCTSTNAQQIFRWAMAGGTQPAADGEEIKLLFLPDQHLGRNTAAKFGITTEVDEAAGRGPAQTAVWNPRRPPDADTIRASRVLLWAGHCSVHKLFRPEHVDEAREKFADRGGVTVLVHPECCQEVVDRSDLDGSTEYIISRIEAAAPGTNWAVATEVHLVSRLAARAAKRDVNVMMLSECQCLCTTMYRIDPAHLLWALDHLAAGKAVNRVQVHPKARELAVLALDRMLAHVGQPAAAPADLVD